MDQLLALPTSLQVRAPSFVTAKFGLNYFFLQLVPKESVPASRKTDEDVDPSSVVVFAPFCQSK
jgi:hypothetical protein